MNEVDLEQFIPQLQEGISKEEYIKTALTLTAAIAALDVNVNNLVKNQGRTPETKEEAAVLFNLALRAMHRSGGNLAEMIMTIVYGEAKVETKHE